MIYSRIRQRKQSDVEIELAPMIDCIFILLIFFIVTSVFVKDPGIEVERPNVSGAQVVNRNSVLIAISEDNTIYFDGHPIEVAEVAQHVKQAVFDEDTPVIIRADTAADHGIFAAVYAEAKKAGVARVQFSTVDPNR